MARVRADDYNNLSPNSDESFAMMAGRLVADMASIGIGGAEIGSGPGIAGGGFAVGCGTTLCLSSAPALAVGAVVTGQGVATTFSGTLGLGENLGRMYSRSSRNDDDLLSSDNQGRLKNQKIGQGEDGIPGNNTAQNNHVKGAIKEIQKQLGIKLNSYQINDLHRSISKRCLSYWEIVEKGIELFGKK